MAELYNLTALKAASTVSDLVSVANTATNSMFAQGFMVVLFIVMIIMYKRDDINQSIFVSAFVCLILSLFLVSAGYLPIIFVIAFAVIWAFFAFITTTFGIKL